MKCIVSRSGLKKTMSYNKQLKTQPLDRVHRSQSFNISELLKWDQASEQSELLR